MKTAMVFGSQAESLNRRLIQFLMLLVSFTVGIQVSDAANGTWLGTSGGNWSTTTLWTGGTVADGSGSVANFDANNINGNYTITVNAARTIGYLEFGDTSGTTIRTFTLNNSGGSVLTLATPTGVPGITVQNVGPGMNITISAPLGGTQGVGITNLDTSSSLTLSSSANTYTGDTIISGPGTVTLGNAAFLPGATRAGNLYVYGTLNLAGLSPSINGLYGSGTVTKSTAGTTTLTVGNNNNDGDYSGVIANTTGTLALTKTGTGTQILSGNNTYSGQTTVSAGALNIRHANALGGTGTGTTVSSGAALQIQNNITTAAEALTLNGSGVANSGALRNMSGNNTYGGNITLASASRINSDSGTLTLSGTVGGNFAKTFGGAGNITANGAINGTASVTKDGGGTLTLNGAGNYSGGTVLSGGTISMGADNALGTGGFNFAGGLLKHNGHTDSSIGVLTLSATSTLDLSGGGSGDLTFSSATYSGGTLTILGWTANPGVAGASDDKIFITGSVDANFLANTVFDIGGTLYFADMEGTELIAGVTAVPEPVEWALIIFAALGGFMKFILPRFRRTPVA